MRNGRLTVTRHNDEPRQSLYDPAELPMERPPAEALTGERVTEAYLEDDSHAYVQDNWQQMGTEEPLRKPWTGSTTFSENA